MSVRSYARPTRWALTPLSWPEAAQTAPRPARCAPAWALAFRQYVRECSVEDLPGVMRGLGLTLYGAALSASARDLRTVDFTRAAVAIGNEGHGLSAEILDMCAGTVIIPMKPGSESLNAAAAGAVAMWEMARRTL